MNSWVFSTLVVVTVAVLLSLAALVWVRKKVSIERLRKDHDAAGFTFSIIGVLYSVILGFMVVNVQDRYREAEKNVREEANLLVAMYHDATAFSNSETVRIRAALRSYVQSILDGQWKGTKDGTLPIEQHAHLWDSYYPVNVTDAKTQVFFEQATEQLDRLMDMSLNREFSAQEHLGSMMWTLLILGAVITTGFMLFFGLEDFKIQLMMTGLLGGYLAFILYLVVSLDHVFTGPMAVKPVVFEKTVQVFDELDREEPDRPSAD